jgi:hypothetical protein
MTASDRGEAESKRELSDAPDAPADRFRLDEDSRAIRGSFVREVSGTKIGVLAYRSTSESQIRHSVAAGMIFNRRADGENRSATTA